MRNAQKKRPAPKKATLALLRRRRDASREKVIECITDIREVLHGAVDKFDKCAGDYKRDQDALDSFLVERERQ